MAVTYFAIFIIMERYKNLDLTKELQLRVIMQQSAV